MIQNRESHVGNHLIQVHEPEVEVKAEGVNIPQELDTLLSDRGRSSSDVGSSSPIIHDLEEGVLELEPEMLEVSPSSLSRVFWRVTYQLEQRASAQRRCRSRR
jgi:hypothetical protein